MPRTRGASRTSSPRARKPKPDHPATRYARDVVEGRIVTGRLVRLACERHLRDLGNGASRGLWFDEEAADRIIEFFENYLRHYKGKWANQPFILELWQKFILGSIFGWKRADGTRRFRKAYISTGRKSGKSPMAGGVGLYLLTSDGEAGAEIYVVATSEKQVERTCFGYATRMARKSPELRDYIGFAADNLHVISTDSKFELVSSEAGSLDGPSVHGGIVEEYHAHPTRDLYDALDTGMGAREQPLLLVVTTAGSNSQSPCHEEHVLGVNILEGRENEDARFFYIATLDEGDDWTDPANFIKANPNLGVTLRLDELCEQLQEALNLPSKQNSFKRKRLNMWTDAEARWLSSEIWAEGNLPMFTAESLKGRECYAGLDLSASTDITALILWFPPTKEDIEAATEEDPAKHKLLSYFWLPEKNLKERCRHDKVAYDQWVQEGLIRLTPSGAVDLRFVRRAINSLGQDYRILQINHDPYRATLLAPDLEDDGFTVVEMPQQMKFLAIPTAEFERLAVLGQIAHNGNKVLSWMMGCTQVKPDDNGNIRPVKPQRKKSSSRIDGIVAAIMALDCVMRPENERSTYEDNEILVI